MSFEKDYSMVDAFLALKDLDDDFVADMVKPSANKPAAGKQLSEGKEFPIYGAGKALEDAKDFLNENDDVQLEVIDVDADSLEHIKNRIEYVGQIILRCNRCHANKFIDMKDLVQDSDDKETYNIDDECPNCKTADIGYSMVGQVGKFEEEEPEPEAADAETSTSDDEAVAVENDADDGEEFKFDNDLEDESETSSEDADAAATDDEVTEISDEEESEPDMMETSSNEDEDGDLELPSLGDEVDVDDELKLDDEDEEDVKESLNEDIQLNKNAEDAWMMNRVIQAMNNEDAYYGSWLYIWPDGETREMCAYDFCDDEDYADLRDTFERTYRRYHNDGLFDAAPEVVEYAHKVDSLLGLAKIENLKPYREELEQLRNTSVNEVLGAVLDADKVKQVVVSNQVDGKSSELFNGEYKDLPINLASAECSGFDVADHQLACNIDQDEVHGRRCVGDILSKFCDDKTENICLVDAESSDEIFRGKKADAIEKFGKCGFISIDTPAVIRLTICDPALIAADKATKDEKDPTDNLVEHVLAANNLSNYRLTKPTSKEFWISESIKQKEDLELIYEAFVKPSADATLIAEFKSVTGYRNELEEAYEAGYKAAESLSEGTATATLVADDVDEDMTLDTLSITWKLDGRAIDQDFVSFMSNDSMWTAAGNVVVVDKEYESLKECILAVISEAEALSTCYGDHCEVEFLIDEELDQYLSTADKDAILDASGYLVEELSEDVDQKYIIVAITKDGERKYYSIEADDFVDTVAEATIYADHDDALADWFEIDKKQYKRVFVPIYDPAAFEECVSEELTTKAASSQLNAVAKNVYDDLVRIYPEVDVTTEANKSSIEVAIPDKVDHDKLEKDILAALHKVDAEPEVLDIKDALVEFIDTDNGTVAIIDNISLKAAKVAEGKSSAPHITCEHCGGTLNDMGTCPKCDDGEEEIDECKLTEAAKGVLDIPDAVAEAIKEVVNNYGMSISDEEIAVMIFDYICDHLDAGMPSDKAEYEAWSNDIYDEINKQIEALINDINGISSEDTDEDGADDEWDDVPAEPTYADPELVKAVVDSEIDDAIKEWGTNVDALTSYLASIVYEIEGEKPNLAELKQLIAAHIEKNSDVTESKCRSFKSRKELAEAIAECKNNSRPYTVKRSAIEGYRYDLYEGDAETTTDIVPAQSNELSELDYELAEKIMRISSDIANAIRDVYGIEAPKNLIVQDIMQDLRLIGGTMDVRDLPDTPANRLTAQMYQSHEDFYAFMDEFVSALTGQSLNATPEKKLAYAVKAMDGPNFTTEAIRAGIESKDFQRLVAAGNVPFIPADMRPQLEEDSDIEVDTDKFDAELNEYFNEAYEESVLYTTASGCIENDGTIILEGLIQSDDIASDVTFTLKPTGSLNESLIAESDKGAVLHAAEYTVTNNLSEEIFTFKFSE